MMKMIHLQVEAPHGLEGISQVMTLEGKGLATTGDRHAGAEVRIQLSYSCFFKQL